MIPARREEVGHLPGSEGADGSIRQLDSVDRIGGEGMEEGMETLLLQPIPPCNLLHTSLEVDHPAPQVDVAFRQPQRLH